MYNLVLTTGTFNIVHAGHIELFNFCKSIGKKVVVGLNGDRYLKSKYGSKAVALEHRLAVLESLVQVNKIIVFEEETPCNLIKLIKPEAYVKGPDYLNKEIAELKILQELNIPLIIENKDKILSTSLIIN